MEYKEKLKDFIRIWEVQAETAKDITMLVELAYLEGRNDALGDVVNLAETLPIGGKDESPQTI